MSTTTFYVYKFSSVCRLVYPAEIVTIAAKLWRKRYPIFTNEELGLVKPAEIVTIAQLIPLPPQNSRIPPPAQSDRVDRKKPSTTPHPDSNGQIGTILAPSNPVNINAIAKPETSLLGNQHLKS